MVTDADREAAGAICAELIDAIGPAITEHETFIAGKLASHRETQNERLRRALKRYTNAHSSINGDPCQCYCCIVGREALSEGEPNE